MKLTKVQVIERKLGKERALGQYCDGVVEIDPRQHAQAYLDTLIHETLHHHFPEATEEQVIIIANQMSETIWAKNYRRIAK